MDRNSWVASESIGVSLFVKMDTANQGQVSLAGANGRAIGISQMGARANAILDTTDPPLAAASGETLQVLEEGEVGFVVAGGTVTRGDWVKSDSDSKAVKATDTSGLLAKDQNILGRALESATSGQLLKIRVHTFQTGPDTTA